MKLSHTTSLVFLLLVGCNAGLEPRIVGKGYLQGTVVYKQGKIWNSSDSVYAVRPVAFIDFPPKSFLDEILSNRAYYLLESLPLNADSSIFTLEIPNAPTTLKYIAIAQQYDKADLTKQKVIGVYTLSGNNQEHSPLYIPAQDTVKVRIVVDFENLPPQPF